MGCGGGGGCGVCCPQVEFARAGQGAWTGLREESQVCDIDSPAHLPVGIGTDGFICSCLTCSMLFREDYTSVSAKYLQSTA